MTPDRPLDDRAADRLLSGRAVEGEEALTGFVSEMAALTPEAPPTPSDALAAMLEAGIPASGLAPTAVLPARKTPWFMTSWGRVGLGFAAAVVVMVGAAATNVLPSPAQTAVADVVGWVTPVHLPHPGEAPEHPVVSPSPSPTEQSHGGSSPHPEDSSATDRHGGDSSPGADSGSKDGGSSGGSGSDDNRTQPTASPTSGSGDGGSGSGGGGSDDGKSSPTPSPTPKESSGSGDGGSGGGGGGGSSPDTSDSH